MLKRQRDDLEAKVFCLNSALICAEDNLLGHQNELALLSLAEKNNVELQSIMDRHAAEMCDMHQNLLSSEKEIAEVKIELDLMTYAYQNRYPQQARNCNNQSHSSLHSHEQIRHRLDLTLGTPVQVRYSVVPSPTPSEVIKKFEH